MIRHFPIIVVVNHPVVRSFVQVRSCLGVPQNNFFTHRHMHLSSHISLSDILSFFDPNAITGALIWCSLSLLIVYAVLFNKKFTLRPLPSAGELHSLLLPYSLPPSEKITAQTVAQGLDSGKYHNVVVLMGAGFSIPFFTAFASNLFLLGVSSSLLPDFRSPNTGLFDQLARDHSSSFADLPNPYAVFDIQFLLSITSFSLICTSVIFIRIQHPFSRASANSLIQEITNLRSHTKLSHSYIKKEYFVVYTRRMLMDLNGKLEFRKTKLLKSTVHSTLQPARTINVVQH